MATTTRTRTTLPGVDVKLLVPTLALIAGEVWFLATQTTSVILPLIWMAPMNLFLLAYAFDETLALAEVALVLFFGRLFYIPFLLMAPMNSFLVFYLLFMAPVDVVIVAYVFGSAKNRVVSTGSPA
jgi:hypothetical protein